MTHAAEQHLPLGQRQQPDHPAADPEPAARGQDGELRYIVQEYVEGSTLKALIEVRGTPGAS